MEGVAQLGGGLLSVAARVDHGRRAAAACGADAER